MFAFVLRMFDYEEPYLQKLESCQKVIDVATKRFERRI